jgi:hypothetical protein
MKIPPRDRPDPQARRERELGCLDVESGDAWRQGHEPGTYGCHELLDRLALVANNLDDWVVSHPACLMNPDWYASAASALDTLWDLYQRVGDAHLDGEDRPRSGGR